jgi:predicted acylesterase/phospholipase RssA
VDNEPDKITRPTTPSSGLIERSWASSVVRSKHRRPSDSVVFALPAQPIQHQSSSSILCDTVDFDAIRNAHCPIKLFLSATNVRTAKIRVFDNNEIGPDAVLASACLPFSPQAIEIDGEHYWDDGYMGNPAISHLFITVTAETSLIKKTRNVDRIVRSVCRGCQTPQSRSSTCKTPRTIADTRTLDSCNCGA